MIKKSTALILSVALLSACSPVVRNSADIDDGRVNGSTTEDSGGDGTNTTGGDDMMNGDTRVISVSVSDIEYSPNTITVKKGEEVALDITATTGVQALVIPDLGVNVVVAEGQTLSIAIPTATSGTFTGFNAEGSTSMSITVIITE